MAAVIDQTEGQNMLNATFQRVAYPTISACQLRLMTANGTTTANGTAVTGGGYTGQTMEMAAPVALTIANSALEQFTNMPAATVVGIEIWTTTTPRRLWFGALAANKTVSAGDTLSFAIGAIVASFA